MIEHVVFFLEEPSAEDFLRGILSGLLPEHISLHFLVFEGKQDLEKQLVRRLKGWLREHSRFFVIRDKDAADCVAVKARLQALCIQAGRPEVVVRIACHELESFFIGDWDAVADAFEDSALRKHGRSAKYRNPDALANPAYELRRLIPSYQKREGARRIAPCLVPGCNRSRSFQVLYRSLVQLAGDASAATV